MANLKKINDLKQSVLAKILASPSIASLLSGGAPPADSQTLLYQSVYPYLFEPEGPDSTPASFLCCDVTSPRSVNKTVLEVNVTLSIYAHFSKIQLTDGDLIDKIAEEADQLLQGIGSGSGKLEPVSYTSYSPEKNFFGKMLTYKTTILNG